MVGLLGMELGLSPGDLAVLDGDLAPSPKKGQSPLSNFRPISIVAKRLHASGCHWPHRNISTNYYLVVEMHTVTVVRSDDARYLVN